MKTVCKQNLCTGCMACADICSHKAINVAVDIKACNAVIDEKLCVDCGVCYKVCQINHPVLCASPIRWYQGWSNDEKVRENSASGGFATEIAKAFIQQGGTVFACVFEKGVFAYWAFHSIEDLKNMAGSKYVKSNPSGIYKKVRTELLAGQEVLFIGLPCHIAGLKNFLNEKGKENLYCVDLICHGSPAPQLLEMFLEQRKICLQDIQEIRFRRKDHFQVEQKTLSEFNSVGFKGVLDTYMIGFLGGLFYTENCYACSYARLERVSDITLGDSWGSDLPLEEQRKGISLALCQTPKGEHLLKMANLQLYPVDLEKAKIHNHQLMAPSEMTVQRQRFFEGISKGNSFDAMIWRTCFVKCAKQMIKKVLIKSNLYRK